MLTSLGDWVNDIISNSLHIFTVTTFLEYLSVNLKNVTFSMGVSLLEKQNWCLREHLGKNPMMYWQYWWNCGILKIIEEQRRVTRRSCCCNNNNKHLL